MSASCIYLVRTFISVWFFYSPQVFVPWPQAVSALVLRHEYPSIWNNHTVKYLILVVFSRVLRVKSTVARKQPPNLSLYHCIFVLLESISTSTNVFFFRFWSLFNYLLVPFCWLSLKQILADIKEDIVKFVRWSSFCLDAIYLKRTLRLSFFSIKQRFNCLRSHSFCTLWSVFRSIWFMN